jgi:hypothetical protein
VGRGGAQKGAARPGSAGYIYRHGWIPVAGSGAVDKRSKAKQKAKPSAPPSPQRGTAENPIKRRPEFAELSDKQVESRTRMFTSLAAGNDLSPDMRETVNKALADLEVERQIRNGDLVEAPPVVDTTPTVQQIKPSVTTPAQKRAVAKVEQKLQSTPAEVAQAPEHRDPERPAIVPTHTGLYHATSARNVDSIKQNGFRSTAGGGENGAFFGAGTYFHTRQEDAEASLDGYRMFIDPDMQQVRAEAQVINPFVVRADEFDMDPSEVMHRALREQGLAVNGEELSPDQITQRLKRAGHDGVEVRQNGFNHEIAGNQLIVFDAAKQTRVEGSAADAVQVQTNNQPPPASVDDIRAAFPRVSASTNVNPGWMVTNRQQRVAVNTYTGSWATRINRGLRGKRTIEPEHAEVTRALDEMFESMPPLQRGLTASRSMQGDGPFPPSPPPMTPGATFEDPGFVSTSKLSSIAGEFGSTDIEIRIPAGAKALDVNHAAWSQNASEEEVLLPRNTRFKVASDEFVSGKRKIVVEVVPT